MQRIAVKPGSTYCSDGLVLVGGADAGHPKLSKWRWCHFSYFGWPHDPYDRVGCRLGCGLKFCCVQTCMMSIVSRSSSFVRFLGGRSTSLQHWVSGGSMRVQASVIPGSACSGAGSEVFAAFASGSAPESTQRRLERDKTSRYLVCSDG